MPRSQLGSVQDHLDRARGRGHSTDSNSTRPKKFHRHTWLTSAQVDEEGGTGGGNRSKEATRKINTWHGPDAYAFGVPVGFLQSPIQIERSTFHSHSIDAHSCGVLCDVSTGSCGKF